MNLIPWRNRGEKRSGSEGAEHSLASLRDEIDSIFERFFRDPWGSSLLSPFTSRDAVALRIDLAESENELTVTAELPGIDSKDVEISVSGNVLTIRGEKKQETEEKERDYHYVERQFGSFQRSVQLPISVDPENVEAVYKNGTLTVTLAKHPDVKPKRIDVKQG